MLKFLWVFEMPITDFSKEVGNILRYGADPLGLVSSVQAINDAINAANAGDGSCDVIVPAGTYLIDDALVLKSNVRIRGIGTGSLFSCNLAANSTYLLTASGISDFRIEGVRFSGVLGSDATDSTTMLAKLINCSNGRIYRCIFDTSYLGLVIDQASAPFSSMIEVDHCRFYNIGINGLSINSQGKDYQVSTNLFYNCGVIADLTTIGAGMELRGIQRSVVKGNIIRDCNYSSAGAVDAIRLEYMTESGGQQVLGVSVTGNVVDNVSGYGVRGQYIVGCPISGNTFNVCGSDGVTLLGNNGVSASSDKNVVSGNTIRACTGIGVSIVGDSTEVCIGNSVNGNTIDSCAYGIYVAHGDKNKFGENGVTGSSSVGVYQASGIGNGYTGNKISGSSAHGIQIAAGTDTYLAVNEAHDNGGWGVIISGGTDAILYYNNMRDNTSGDYSNSGTGTTKVP